MVKSLRESKAKLSELVDAASRGEDVLITVRGKVKARLTKAEDAPRKIDGAKWARELREFQKTIVNRDKSGLSMADILAEVRKDRF